ncbi:type II membrane protein [Zygosaccharomyces mellis]|uniref:Autophagy-related protein 27 n=1 Tax=Zygosaccharomyces mellis TaxID=42258 RepID=A0A4C2E1G2_9SACH|nr:type II membrane protein [Zygosaccharomyces mellis]
MLMKFTSTILLSLLFARYTDAIKCNSDDVLKRYQISKNPLSSGLQRDTPPSKTDEQWYIGVCEEDGFDKISPDCNSKDILCGTTHVKLPGKDPILTQVIDFTQNVKHSTEQQKDGFTLKLTGAEWGSGQYDALIEFKCSDDKDTDEMFFDRWQGSEVKLSVLGPSGCLKKDDNDGGHGGSGGDNDNNNGSKKPNKSSGSSWFTWLFLYAILFTLIYLSIISYANTRGGSFQDFKEEFLDRLKQLITSLPQFVKEIASRLFGSSSSPRGGYSAV